MAAGSSAPMRSISGLNSCAARSCIYDALAVLLVASPGSEPPGSPNISPAPSHRRQRLPDRPRLVIATGNTGKLREYRDLLAEAGLDLVAFDTEIDEVGETYAENARLKAEAARERSGLPSLGDDSGLEVEALDGFPGIRSARLGPSQKERTAELLQRLQG